MADIIKLWILLIIGTLGLFVGVTAGIGMIKDHITKRRKMKA